MKWKIIQMFETTNQYFLARKWGYNPNISQLSPALSLLTMANPTYWGEANPLRWTADFPLPVMAKGTLNGWLVVEPTPLKNMSQLGSLLFIIPKRMEKQKKQTTNQPSQNSFKHLHCRSSDCPSLAFCLWKNIHSTAYMSVKYISWLSHFT